MLDMTAGLARYFGERVSDELQEEWSDWLQKRQVIGQAELLPVLLALQVWRPWCQGRRILLFVDNEAARFGPIKGASDSRHSRNLLRHIATARMGMDAVLWVARVPSTSNPADGPSRLDFAWVQGLPAIARDVPIQPLSLEC